MKELFPSSFGISRTLSRTFFALVIFLIPSCSVLDTHQAKLDQTQLRDVLMDYTEDQILDNLIRARNGVPIIHYDLSHITAQVTSKVTPTVGGGRSVTDVRTHTPTHMESTTAQTSGSTVTTTSPVNQTITNGFMNTVGRSVSVVGGLVETVAKPFTWGVSGERDNVVNIEAEPLIDEPEVYAAYIKFLKARSSSDVTPACKAETSEQSKVKVPMELTTLTTTTTDPSTVTKTIKSEQKSGGVSSQGATASSSGTTTETTVVGQTALQTKEEVPKGPKPPDLVLQDFDGITSLRRSPSPPKGSVLVGPKRWRDGMFYWVPVDYRRQFFELCMATVARGAEEPATVKKGADKAQEKQTKALKEFNSLQRQRLLTPP